MYIVMKKYLENVSLSIFCRVKNDSIENDASSGNGYMLIYSLLLKGGVWGKMLIMYLVHQK